MGLIGKIVRKQISSIVTVQAVDIANKALDKAEKKLESRPEKNNDKLFEKQPGVEILVVKQYGNPDLGRYSVFDENKQSKYSIKGKLKSSRPRIHIYDAGGKEKGLIRGKGRPIFPTLNYNTKLEIIIDGNTTGTIKRKNSLGKLRYKFDYNGWIIEDSVVGSKTRIIDEGEEVAQILHKLRFEKTYVIHFADPQNEFIVLMLSVAFNSAKRIDADNYERAVKRDGWKGE